MSSFASLPKGERDALLVEVFEWIANQGGWLPEEAYYARLKAFPAAFQEMIEIAPGKDGFEVLMDMRPPSDQYYGGRYGTHGSTIMMQQAFSDVLRKNAARELGLSAQLPNAPWRFCGLVMCPHTRREHACAHVFARLHHVKPEGAKGTWIPVSDIVENSSYPIIPSSVVYADTAIGVLLRGDPVGYREFFGTDD